MLEGQSAVFVIDLTAANEVPQLLAGDVVEHVAMAIWPNGLDGVRSRGALGERAVLGRAVLLRGLSTPLRFLWGLWGCPCGLT